MTRKDYYREKWKAAGEMWRLDLAQELFRRKMAAELQEELDLLHKDMIEPLNGLTNRQRRELDRDVRKQNHAISEKFFSYLSQGSRG
jgi:hypothetical protein